MAVLLALAAALSYGLSDFLGGLVSRRSAAWSVAVVVQVASAAGAAALAMLVAGEPTAGHLAWGAAAGVASGAGVGFLYRGLAHGRMSVVAPLSAVGAALVPVAAGLAQGERPAPVVSVALVAALPAIWLVASGGGPTGAEQSGSSDNGVVDGLLAGVGFGSMFALLGQVPDEAGLWPLALTQAVSVVAVVALAAALGERWWPDRPALRAVPAGLLGALAVLCFLLASQSGLLTVSAVLTSLYPASTVVLAVLVLRERIQRGQAWGLALCAVTVTLVAIG